MPKRQGLREKRMSTSGIAVDASETIKDRIERKRVKWFGHFLRMPDKRWPRKIFKWKPPGMRKRGRRRSWSESVRRTVEARNLENHALDRED